MHKKTILLAGLMAVLAVQPAMADDDELGWSGSLGLGLLVITGNTESEALNFDGELNWDGERWHHTLIGRALNKVENDVTTSEAYKAAYDAKFDLTDRTYLFGLVDYNRDRFSGYDQQVFEVVGVGRRFIVSEKHQLSGELGFGAAQNDLKDGPSENEFTTRASGEYVWKISENATFSQTLAVNWADSNTFTESISELRTGIAGNLGLAVSLTVKNNSDVAPGIDKTDTWTGVNLDYAF